MRETKTILTNVDASKYISLEYNYAQDTVSVHDTVYLTVMWRNIVDVEVYIYPELRMTLSPYNPYDGDSLIFISFSTVPYELTKGYELREEIMLNPGESYAQSYTIPPSDLKNSEYFLLGKNVLSLSQYAIIDKKRGGILNSPPRTLIIQE